MQSRALGGLGSSWPRVSRPALSRAAGTANRRVAGNRTVYHDNVTPCTGGACYVDVELSHFNGLGHYRRSTRTSNFPRSSSRVDHTNYNKTSSVYQVDSGGNQVCSPPATCPYLMVPWYEPWVLNGFDEKWSEEGGAAALSLFTFDPAKGALTGVRTLKGEGATRSSIVLHANDLHVSYCRDGSGNVVHERYRGGDRASLPTTVAPCTAFDANAGEYELEHTYQYGVRKTTKHTGATFFDVDRTIDFGSGLPSIARDSAGVPTTFTYDALGRLRKRTFDNGAWSDMAYAGPDSATPRPTLFLSDRSANGALLTETVIEYDGLGRIAKEKRRVDNSTWALRETQYDAIGSKAAVSEWEATPTNFTKYLDYDAFGRVGRIVAPDQSEVTLTYTGTVGRTKSVLVRTGGDDDTFNTTQAITTEVYDADGRLVEVQEPGTVGTTALYEYDIAGRLKRVCVNAAGAAPCVQQRLFDYDNRGFLLSETHPEKGTGNGTTQYSEYDARGHAARRLDGAVAGPFDVGFQYDAAERLVRVEKRGIDAASTRTLKIFEFGTSSVSGDAANGKLKKAVRFNWFDLGGATFNAQVVETYTYGGTDGRPSIRTTDQFDCQVSSSQTCQAVLGGTPTRSFTQSFTYDGFGQVTALGYPSCVTGGCSGLDGPTIVNEYAHGRLAAVFNQATPTRRNKISYHSNGLFSTVEHANFVLDQQFVAAHGMPRPHALQTSRAITSESCVAPSIHLQPTPQSAPAGATVKLTAGVTADDDRTAHPLTYQWYEGTPGNVAQSTVVPNSNKAEITPVVSNTTYWMRATNNCNGGATADTIGAPVTVCSLPVITTQPINRKVTRNQTSANLSVGAYEGTLSYQWYIGVQGVTTNPVADGGTAELVVAPQTTTTYWVRVRNSCGTVDSNAATVTVYEPPTAPVGIDAAATSSAQISITWSPSTAPAGLAHYVVERRHDSSSFTVIAGSHLTTSITNSGLAAWRSYVYRVKAVDVNGGSSPWSQEEFSTTVAVTDPGSLAGVVIRKAHFLELRTAIDALRRTAGAPPMAWTAIQSGGVIRASHVVQMREAVAEARGMLGHAVGIHSAPVLTPSQSVIRNEDLEELREGVR